MTLKPLLWAAGAVVAALAFAVASAQAPDSFDAQVARGQTAYNAHCAVCHASDLTGNEFSSALLGRSFNRTYGGKPAKELFERIRDTMPQGTPNTLPAATYLDIVALIAKTNEYKIAAPITEANAGEVILAP